MHSVNLVVLRNSTKLSKMSSNIENIIYGDFKSICRACMCNCEIKFTGDCIISNIYYKLTDIHFETHDELPQQICLKCFDKINEIREFSFQCKRTHSVLTQCLSKIQIKEEPDAEEQTNKPKESELLIKLEENIMIDEQQQESNLVMMLEEEITVEEHKIEFVKHEELNSTNDVNDELGINRNILENANNLLNDDMIPKTNEINVDQSINCSETNLLKTNTSNIEVVIKEESNNTNQKDLKKDTNTNTNSDSYKNKDEQYKCEVSNKILSHLKSFKVHKSGGPYRCKQCSKSFMRSRNLQQHMRSHSSERPYKCEQCSKSFADLYNMKKHIRTHTGERPYKCNECSKSFTESTSLTRHERIHSGQRPYWCNQCSKAFVQASELKSHMRIHSGERPYKCTLCAKSYTVAGGLTIHMRTHSGERPFMCDQCSKSFTESSGLKRHMLSHSRERPYWCEQCSKTFAASYNLKIHMLTHSGERPE